MILKKVNDTRVLVGPIAFLTNLIHIYGTVIVLTCIHMEGIFFFSVEREGKHGHNDNEEDAQTNYYEMRQIKISYISIIP